MAFIAQEHGLGDQNTGFSKKIFEKLFNIAEYSNLTKEEKDMYNTALKRKWDNQAVLEYAVETAVKTAVEEERAKAEAAKLASALALKQTGVSVLVIANALGLSINQVEQL